MTNKLNIRLSNKWKVHITEVDDLLKHWLLNFTTDSKKKLAYKILDNILYYNDKKFKFAIRKLKKEYYQVLQGTNSHIDDSLLIVDKGHADSSHKLAYDVVKQFELPRQNIVSIEKIEQYYTENRHIFLFNDTHGSGNQIIRTILDKLKNIPMRSLTIICISISQTAYKRIKSLIPNATLLFNSIAPSIFDNFNNPEIEEITRIGTKINPSHPIGYGNLGLLLAYYYQCPNNSIPLIWYESQNNFNWIPLFKYNAKKKKTSVIKLKKDFKLVTNETICDIVTPTNTNDLLIKLAEKNKKNSEAFLRYYLLNLKKTYIKEGDPITLYNKNIMLINKFDQLFEKKSVNLGMIHTFFGYLLINANLNNYTLKKAKL